MHSSNSVLAARMPLVTATLILSVLMAQTCHSQSVITDCDPSKCQPLSNISETSLEPGQRIRRELDPCCEILRLYCDASACPPAIEFCDAERTIRPRTTVGTCCTLQRCENFCEVYADGEITTRSVGEKWFNMVNETTCMNYECLRNEANETFINSIGIQCNTTCPEGFEAQISHQHCCPQCVQARCKFDDQFYREGQSWASPDGCLLYRCAKDGGFLSISSSRKQCPVVGNCPEQNVVERDCCKVCNYTAEPRMESTTAAPVEQEEGVDFYEEQSYSNHPCKRVCTLGRKPETCYYRFRLEWYRTLSKACYNCPYNGTDCDRPHCIAGDGVRRNVAVINRMMPGPAIEVCENDIIVVDVENHLMGESTTIHWHGLHQRRTPYMDGVPHVSQCPISPGTTFRYTFRADNPGTHFWHSHTGMQRGDGAFGALIIRKDNDIHELLYDHDLSEHVITVQDWGHEQGVSLFAAHHHSTGDNKPPNLLINGRGKYFQRFAKTTPLGTTTTTEAPDLEEDPSVTTQPEAIPVEEVPEETTIVDVPTTVAPTVTTLDDVELLQASSNNNLKTVLHANDVRHRTKRQSRTVNFNAVVVPESQHIPLSVFHVDKGRRYRFRLINAEFLNCPVELSIENHNLTVISSDGFGIQPLEDLGSFVSYAGERFDFVVKANQPIGNYLIRFRGLMDCDERFTSAYQFAVLRYRGAPEDTEYESWPPYDYEAPGVQFNSLNRGPGAENVITIAETNALDQEDLLLLRDETDYKFYVYYDFYGKDNPHFHVPSLYGFQQVINNTNRLYTPQLNHISMRMPPIPFLPGKDVLDESQFCNETSVRDRNCREEFCECSHVIQIPLHATVEMVMIDEGFTFDANHPFHLHGHAFRVVGMDRVSRNTTVEDIRRMDEEGRLPRRLKKAPIKDTVTIPDGGYTIIRFIANNPGYWLFHCHIEFHAEIGMSLVLKVGDSSEMLPVPANFPTCYDFKPKLGELGNGTGSTRFTTSLLLLAFAVQTLHRLL
ncbi:laccase abr2 isoform X1 [Anopheles stephensi]|uniref:laccase abr2 isoform X1 n=2 Tax=Anopheles stephensi TaxID=30069 RepID=UPI0016587CC4|nr:laccase abr2 isoform X1 [Anopheles stephensi]XP_035891290.1 laccase abr2 isoform X1 [Anopheles stephensi]XP_035891291.1 laccase abr2 isoform X1 [Anopheles stephensi]XP_035891292.1 laccase abr2 isoform X1 [Anopheles stephensi]